MSLDAELTLYMLRMQLLRLEHEVFTLRQLVDQNQESQPQRGFQSLAGVWRGVDVKDEDFEPALLRVPEDI